MWSNIVSPPFVPLSVVVFSFFFLLYSWSNCRPILIYISLTYFSLSCSLPGLPKDFVPKDPKLLLPKDFQPNKEFHPKIGNDDDEEDDDINADGDDDGDHTNSFPNMPGSLPRTNGQGHGKQKSFN